MSNNRGFASVLPLLAIALIAVVVGAVFKNRSTSSSLNTQSVLSESVGEGRFNGKSEFESLSDSELELETEEESQSFDRNSEDRMSSEKVERENIRVAPTSVKTTVELITSKEELRTSEPRPKKFTVRSPQPSPRPEKSERPEPVRITDPVEFEFKTETREGVRSSVIKIQEGDNKFEVQKEEGSVIEVRGEFPLSVNTETKELVASTSAGTKAVATLPDRAIDNLVTKGIFDNSRGVQLTVDNKGDLQYEIHGSKAGKFLGIFNVSLNKTAQVSVQSGQVVSVKQNMLNSILDLLTF